MRSLADGMEHAALVPCALIYKDASQYTVAARSSLTTGLTYEWGSEDAALMRPGTHRSSVSLVSHARFARPYKLINVYPLLAAWPTRRWQAAEARELQCSGTQANAQVDEHKTCALAGARTSIIRSLACS